MNSNGDEAILNEMRKLGKLKSKSESKLIRTLAGFIFDQYSMYPTEEEVILVCKAALKMFGNIKGGIVSISDQH